MLGDRIRGFRGVVGHEAHRTPTVTYLRDRLRGVRNGTCSVVDGAVEVEQDGIVSIEQRLRHHPVNSPARSAASVSPSSSASAAWRNHWTASSVRPAATRLSAYA